MIGLERYPHWDMVLMCIALAIVFGFEMLGVSQPGKYVTITSIVKQTCPKWVLAMVWGWLLYHFIIQ
jgi:hypothetical protein